MRQFVISEQFFKSIADRGKLYSRLWFYWLGGYIDVLFEPDFIEKQEKQFSHISEIREIYHYGVQLLQQDFAIKTIKPKVVVAKQINIGAEEVLAYFNEKAGTRFLKKGSNLELINARINEGYTLEDMKSVVDKKVLEWKGTEMEKYLRPITIFNKTKFENYLNQKNESPATNFDKFAQSFAKAKQFISPHTNQ